MREAKVGARADRCGRQGGARGRGGPCEPAESQASREWAAGSREEQRYPANEGQGPGVPAGLGERIQQPAGDGESERRQRPRIADTQDVLHRTENHLAINRAVLVVLLAAFSGLLATVGDGSARLLERPFPGFLVWDNGQLVAFHREGWTGARAQLPLGNGQVIAVDGEPFAGGAELLAHAASLPAGSVIEYRVRSGDRESVILVPTMWLTATDYFITFGNYLFNAVVFIAIGLISLRLRPDSLQARTLAYATLWVGALFLLAIDYFCTYRLVWACQLAEAGAPLAVFAFASTFPYPRGSASSRRGLALALGAVALGIFWVQSASFYRDPSAAQWAVIATYVSLALAVVCLLVGLATAALHAPEPVDRVKAAIVLAAAVSGLMVPAFAILAFFALGGIFSFTWVTFLLPLFPAATLFSIVRHDLIGAERVARLAVGYAVATGAMAVGYATLVYVLDRLLEGFVLGGAEGQFFALMALGLTFHPLYQRVQRSIDRVFYRSEFDAGRVLERMSVLLAARVGEREVGRIVEREILAALAVDWAALEEPGAVGERTASLEEPVVYHGELVGVLRVGPKLLGAPFSEQECDLIVGIASQAATAIHNARSNRDLQDTQQALVQAERLAAIGEVAGAVAHGLRNPLAGIRAAAQMAQEIDDPDDLDEALGDLIAGTDRLDARVRRLLDFARMLEPELRPIDLNALLEEVRATLATSASQRGVALEVPGASSALRVTADSGQLAEALIELASNALRATPEGGRVEISASAVEGEVRVDIRDDGCGIPAQVQSRVFDLFFTTHETGTGMGLATVKKMLERQGGRVELVESTSAGTSFAATLPAA